MDMLVELPRNDEKKFVPYIPVIIVVPNFVLKFRLLPPKMEMQKIK